MTTKAKAAAVAPPKEGATSKTGYARRVDELSTLFGDLEGVEGERPIAGSSGAPLELPIDEIEEDPDQPRKAFDEVALQELAASIRERGVLQAIVVSPKGEGVGAKHRIRYGARRFRAARLAGLTAIRAVIRDASDDGNPYDQMIENIQRDDLSASEVAAFIMARVSGGETQADVARRLGKDKSYVAVHAAVADMPGQLRAKLDSGAPIRGVYELFQAWKKHPDAVLAFCAGRETFTRSEALALAKRLRSPPAATRAEAEPNPRLRDASGGAGPQNSGDETRPRDRAAPAFEPIAASSAGGGRNGPVGASPARQGAAEGRALPTLIVKHRQRLGRLHLDRFAGQGARFGLVRFDDDQEPVEVPLSELRLAELVGFDG